jgi:hypothetical protein
MNEKKIMDDLIRIVRDMHSHFRWQVRHSLELFAMEPKVVVAQLC